MLRALSLHLLGLGMLSAIGCSTTLTEFRCTTNSECSEDGMNGQCHSSGFCAYEYVDNCDGLTFGQYSGDRSGQCVDSYGSGDGGPGSGDGKVPDGTPATLMAVIAPFELDCGKTTINLDGKGSTAAGGLDLMAFEWTIRKPSGEVLEKLNGAPNAAFTPNDSFISGRIEAPVANLTPYESNTALFLNTFEETSLVLQPGISIPTGTHRLSLALARDLGGAASPTLQVQVRNIQSTVLTSRTLPTSDVMVTSSFEFTVAQNQSFATITFQANTGQFWIDNVRLIPQTGTSSNDAQAIANSSFENGYSPWEDSLVSPSAESAPMPLPVVLGQFGSYTVELVVVDSDGMPSAPASQSFDHQPCL